MGQVFFKWEIIIKIKKIGEVTEIFFLDNHLPRIAHTYMKDS